MVTKDIIDRLNVLPSYIAYVTPFIALCYAWNNSVEKVDEILARSPDPAITNVAVSLAKEIYYRLTCEEIYELGIEYYSRWKKKEVNNESSRDYR